MKLMIARARLNASPDKYLSDQLTKRWFCLELPMTDYTRIRDLQSELVAARKAKTIETDLILLLEHPPVFTLGRRGGDENLKVSESFLKKSGIRLIQAERGGNITFHGPGQLIIYLIIDLNSAGLKVADFVLNLEEVMIRTVADWSITACRSSLNRGIWVDGKKLGSIGIAVRGGISFHGMALNVNLPLEPFNWINPCGLKDIRVTTMTCEALRNISISEVRASVKRHTEAIFGVRLKASKLSSLQGRIAKAKTA